MKEDGCQEINLDFCAGVLYAIEKSDGIKSPGTYDLWQETILGDYITKEQVYEFGRTGKGLDVIYFKDKKGEKTKKPAICYVFNPKVKKYRLSDIERNIDFWEKLVPGFLRALVANDVRVLFQSQASSDKRAGGYKYEFGMIYFNDSNERGDGPSGANMAWWNAHPAAPNRKSTKAFTCLTCGQSFVSGGKRERQYCSLSCYGRSRAGQS